ncbi:hypothetical protein LguiB_013259 [Lonicera macranthoides]
MAMTMEEKYVREVFDNKSRQRISTMGRGMCWTRFTTVENRGIGWGNHIIVGRIQKKISSSSGIRKLIAVLFMRINLACMEFKREFTRSEPDHFLFLHLVSHHDCFHVLNKKFNDPPLDYYHILYNEKRGKLENTRQMV